MVRPAVFFIVLQKQVLLAIIYLYLFLQLSAQIFESEGGAGIPFPPTPFPSRAARAVWDFAQKKFALHSEYPTIRLGPACGGTRSW